MSKFEMKMAKASKEDLDAAMDLRDAFECIEGGCDPENEEHEFNIEDRDDCQRALKHMLGIYQRGSLMRVVFGMSVLLDPRNQIVDPDLPHLQLHPRFRAQPASRLAGDDRGLPSK